MKAITLVGTSTVSCPPKLERSMPSPSGASYTGRGTPLCGATGMASCLRRPFGLPVWRGGGFLEER
tara:strand:+ start:398 stop:595 length:198 start_codon:yes stop_codon:yes gene_type:complete